MKKKRFASLCEKKKEKGNNRTPLIPCCMRKEDRSRHKHVNESETSKRERNSVRHDVLGHVT